MTDDASTADVSGQRPPEVSLDAALLERITRARAARKEREVTERIASAREAIDAARARSGSRIRRSRI